MSLEHRVQKLENGLDTADTHLKKIAASTVSICKSIFQIQKAIGKILLPLAPFVPYAAVKSGYIHAAYVFLLSHLAK